MRQADRGQVHLVRVLLILAMVVGLLVLNMLVCTQAAQVL
jgi:hypothetical protein